MLLPRLIGSSCCLVMLAAAGAAHAEEPLSTGRPSPLLVEASSPTPSRPRIAHGGYVAPVIKLTSLAGSGAVLFGAEGGWLVGHVFVVGAAGYVSATSVLSPPELRAPSSDTYLHVGYGGPRLGGVLWATEPTHLTFGATIAGGSASSGTATGSQHRSDQFLLVEPDIAAEVTLGQYARLVAGGSYRIVARTDGDGFTPTTLGGPAATLSIRFGEF